MNSDDVHVIVMYMNVCMCVNAMNEANQDEFLA